MLNKLFIVLILSIYSYGSFKQDTVKINNTTSTDATINIGNLKVGQSGIIVHNYNEKQSIIVASAIVVSSNNQTSKIQFIKFNDLSQEALPTIKLKPVDNDTLVLNYLYNKSLLIAPNAESYKSITKILPNQTFLNSDIFASFLKLDANPTPSKKDIMEFCRLHNLATIYIVVENNYYVVDAKSFMIIDKQILSYKDSKNEQPFYTKVDSIEKNSFAWFESASIGDYTQYYSNIFNLKAPSSKVIIVDELEEDSWFDSSLKVLGL